MKKNGPNMLPYLYLCSFKMKKIVYTKRVANTKNHSVNLFHLHFFFLENSKVLNWSLLNIEFEPLKMYNKI